MANFASVANILEGILNTQLTAARQGQHVWEWFNALQRIVSANYVTGTVRVVGPSTAGDTDFVAIDTTATLYGALIDNSIAAEAVFVSIIDGDATLTPGTEHQPGVILHVPAATMRTFLWPGGVSYPTTGMAIYAGTGTNAGLEAGTAVTGTNPTYVVVYTE